MTNLRLPCTSSIKMKKRKTEIFLEKCIQLTSVSPALTLRKEREQEANLHSVAEKFNFRIKLYKFSSESLFQFDKDFKSWLAGNVVTLSNSFQCYTVLPIKASWEFTHIWQLSHNFFLLKIRQYIAQDLLVNMRLK